MKEKAILGALLDIITDAVTVVDNLGIVLYWNTAAEQTYGIARQDIIGRRIADYFQRESVMLFQVMESGEHVTQLYHEPRPGMHVVISAAPVSTPDGVMIGAISVEKDITPYVRLSHDALDYALGSATLPAAANAEMQDHTLTQKNGQTELAGVTPGEVQVELSSGAGMSGSLLSNSGIAQGLSGIATLGELTDRQLVRGDGRTLGEHSAEVEKMRIMEAMQQAEGNKAKAARLLGISRGSLYYKLKQLKWDK
jgi:PAS domain S-box-containing protein